jgi:membrane-associated phospholipid phosphatase
MTDQSAGRSTEFAAWIAVLCALVFAPISHVWFDRAVSEAARANNLVRSQVLQWTTELGEAGWWLVPAAIVFAVAALRKQHNLARWSFAMFVAVGGSGLIAIAAKFLVGKTRPKMWFAEGEFGFDPLTYGYDYNSMPSGHATTAGAASVILALALPRLAPLILPLGFALALTRVAVEAHYLSDICAGLALGASCALMSLIVWRRWRPASVPQTRV